MNHKKKLLPIGQKELAKLGYKIESEAVPGLDETEIRVGVLLINGRPLDQVGYLNYYRRYFFGTDKEGKEVSLLVELRKRYFGGYRVDVKRKDYLE